MGGNKMTTYDKLKFEALVSLLEDKKIITKDELKDRHEKKIKEDNEYYSRDRY